MSGYDLMHDKEDELWSTELRARGDMVLFLHGFAVAYQRPTGSDSRRGYLTAWVTYDRTDDPDPQYERMQGMSGDNEMILDMFSEMAEGDTERIEKFIDRT